MIRALSLPLLIALMMFPQIVETIYSPALTDIALAFNVSQESAGQTLSLYFLAFAFGVVTWGYLCDGIGRKPTILIALSLYGVSTVGALFSADFSVLLMFRMLMAFSAAIGSIGTQTVMRDRLTGETLRYIFSIMGIALAISPIVGMLMGAIMVKLCGYKAVFMLLTAMAVILLGWTMAKLPETKPETIQRASFWQTFSTMLQDKDIRRTAYLIALLNIALFAYYQLAPFMFEELNLTPTHFGLSGILLGLGSFLGAYLNQYWIKNYQFSSDKLIRIASVIALVSSIAVWLLSGTWFFVIPMVGIVMAYGIAIPNILSKALANYGDKLGAAGAILGLLYYCLIGIGLIVMAYVQLLGICLTVLSIAVAALAFQRT